MNIDERINGMIISGYPLRRRNSRLAGMVGLAAIAASTGAMGQTAEPTFQGHAAEMQMRSDEAERRWRALFFDSLDLEIGQPGLSCDHVARSKPQAIAGRGHVVLVRVGAESAKRIRVWLPPESAHSLEDASGRAVSLAMAATGAAAAKVEDRHTFLWCR